MNFRQFSKSLEKITDGRTGQGAYYKAYPTTWRGYNKVFHYAQWNINTWNLLSGYDIYIITYIYINNFKMNY